MTGRRAVGMRPYGARRDPEGHAEATAEMRLVSKPPSPCDVGDTLVGVIRIDQIGPAAFKPLPSDVIGEAFIAELEQPLNIAGRQLLLPGDVPDTEGGRTQLVID